MTSTTPEPITHRSRFIWIGASLCAIAISGGAAAVYAATAGDDEPTRPSVSTPVVTPTTVADPRDDPLVVRYGRRWPDPHEYPRGTSQRDAAPDAESVEDPLITRYGRP